MNRPKSRLIHRLFNRLIHYGPENSMPTRAALGHGQPPNRVWVDQAGGKAGGGNRCGDSYLI